MKVNSKDIIDGFALLPIVGNIIGAIEVIKGEHDLKKHSKKLNMIIKEPYDNAKKAVNEYEGVRDKIKAAKRLKSNGFFRFLPFGTLFLIYERKCGVHENPTNISKDIKKTKIKIAELENEILKINLKIVVSESAVYETFFPAKNSSDDLKAQRKFQKIRNQLAVLKYEEIKLRGELEVANKKFPKLAVKI